MDFTKSCNVDISDLYLAYFVPQEHSVVPDFNVGSETRTQVPLNMRKAFYQFNHLSCPKLSACFVFLL